MSPEAGERRRIGQPVVKRRGQLARDRVLAGQPDAPAALLGLYRRHDKHAARQRLRLQLHEQLDRRAHERPRAAQRSAKPPLTGVVVEVKRHPRGQHRTRQQRAVRALLDGKRQHVAAVQLDRRAGGERHAGGRAQLARRRRHSLIQAHRFSSFMQADRQRAGFPPARPTGARPARRVCHEGQPIAEAQSSAIRAARNSVCPCAAYFSVHVISTSVQTGSPPRTSSTPDDRSAHRKFAVRAVPSSGSG